MNGEAEIYERLNQIEVDIGRHDERLKHMENLVKEIRDAVSSMQIKLAGVVAVVTLLVNLGFKLWR